MKWLSATPSFAFMRHRHASLIVTGVMAATSLLFLDDVVSGIKGSLELWPTLVEIGYFQKGRKGLPQTRVNNQRKVASVA